MVMLEPGRGGRSGLQRPQRALMRPANCIAFLVRSKPRMLRTRLKLYANTLRLISVVTFDAAGQKVRPAHPVLEHAEDMLDDPLAHLNGIGHMVQPSLDQVHDFFVLPSPDASVLACCALRLHRTARAGTGRPIDDLKSSLFAAEAEYRSLAHRALVLVVVSDVDEVRLVESAHSIVANGRGGRQPV